MQDRKIFPRYPPEWARHPDVLDKRVSAVEEHLEQSPQSSSGSHGLFAPLTILIVEILSAVSLVSPAVRETLLKLLGH